MKIKIKKVAAKNPHTQANGYVVRVVSNGTKSFEDIATESCANTTLNEHEAVLAANLVIKGIATAVKNGYIVDCGPLGKLYPSATAGWKANAADLLKDDVKPHVNFRASDDVAAAIKGATLQWTNADDEEEDTSANSGNTGDDDELSN